MSTALERVMRERGDFDCLHEPFLHYYYLERSGKTLPHFDSESEHPVGYADTRDMILARAEAAAVFAKDMSYYVIPELLEDAAFCRRVRHCFLIRNPMRSILSYYKLDPKVSCSEIGIEAHWRHFDGLRRMGIDDCVVIEAEAVQADTGRAMRNFWSELGLDFREQALYWKQQETPRDWQYVEGWHASVRESGGIRRDADAAEAQAQAEFETLCEQAPRLSDYLAHHLPYYRKLRAHSLASV